MSGDLWLFGVVAAPLLGAALAAAGVGRAVWALLAASAAALAAVALAPGAQAAAPGLLLGVTLEATPALAPAFLGAGLVWGGAAIHAAGYMRADPRARGFMVLFALAQTGNTLLLLASDLPAFYLGFSLMSLSAWGLVAHRRDAAARRAERVYLVFAVGGELALFAAIILIVAAASGSLLTPLHLDLPPPQAAAWLAIVAFAAKAGLAPLHVWLPLAHPAAPVPASAALSGAMLKAGVVGALKLTPPALTVAPALGHGLLALGLVSGFGAALYAACLRDRKTVLAWSSVSQLSLGFGLLGAGFAGLADPALVAAAMALLALHHGVAKGALFLGVDGGMTRWAGLAAMAVPALALTGAPLTAGYAAKAAFEAAAQPAWLQAAFGLTGYATALAMARVLSLQAAATPAPEALRAAGLTLLVAATVAAGGWLAGAQGVGLSALGPAALLAATLGALLWLERLAPQKAPS